MAACSVPSAFQNDHDLSRSRQNPCSHTQHTLHRTKQRLSLTPCLPCLPSYKSNALRILFLVSEGKSHQATKLSMTNNERFGRQWLRSITCQAPWH